MKIVLVFDVKAFQLVILCLATSMGHAFTVNMSNNGGLLNYTKKL